MGVRAEAAEIDSPYADDSSEVSTSGGSSVSQCDSRFQNVNLTDGQCFIVSKAWDLAVEMSGFVEAYFRRYHDGIGDGSGIVWRLLGDPLVKAKKKNFEDGSTYAKSIPAVEKIVGLECLREKDVEVEVREDTGFCGWVDGRYGTCQFPCKLDQECPEGGWCDCSTYCRPFPQY